MFSVKSKLNFSDIYAGLFFSQFGFPTILIWIGILALNFMNQIMPLIHSGKAFYAMILFLIYTLRLVITMVVIIAFFVIVGAMTGRLKTNLLEQEYFFDGTTITDKADGLEQKGDLKNIFSVIESENRFLLFKSGFKVEIISKKKFSPEDTAKVRDFFKSKNSLFLKHAFRIFPYLIVALVGIVALGLFKPSYHMETSFSPMEAFWQDDELVITVQTNIFGYRETLFENIFPSKAGHADIRKPYYEMHFFDIKDGELTELTLASNTGISIRPYGQNLYSISMKKAKGSGQHSTFLKLKGWSVRPTRDGKGQRVGVEGWQERAGFNMRGLFTTLHPVGTKEKRSCGGTRIEGCS